MLRAFPMSLTGVASLWLRNKPTGSITTWEDLKTKFLSKYCPPSRTAKKMEKINNFQQEPDENLYQAWERFKELLMKCPQHYLTEMQEVVLFYNRLDVPTQQILNSRGAIPSKPADAKTAIQEMVEYSQKWHNGTLRVNKKVYAAQVGCEQRKRPHYTKDFPLKEEGKTLEEAYYTQFGGPFQGGGYRATAPGFYQRNNMNPSYQEQRQSMEDTLSKFMGESAKRHEENSNLIKEIRASTDPAIRNQGASIKPLEIQIGQMSKITLRVGEERIVFTCVKPSSSLIKRVYMLSLRERIELDLEARLMGETLVLNRSLDPFLEDYIELNDPNEPFKLRRNQEDDLMPTIEEGEVIEEFRTRDDELDIGIDDYASYCDYDKKIHIDYAHNLKTLEAKNINEYWWRIHKSGDLEVLES
ncbi:pyruvate dehydrogenase (acetyl-transferring) kinase, mitochondrial [Tanacetum coccineum]